MENYYDVTICRHEVIIKLFDFVLFLLSSLVTGDGNIVTDCGIMTNFFYKGLAKNPEIGNTPVWILPNICWLGQVRDTKFGTVVSNKMFLNAAKFQGYSFFLFWVIKGKPTGGKNIPFSPQPD